MKWIILLLLPLLCFAQDDEYEHLLKLSEKEFTEEIHKNIYFKGGSDLFNFLVFLQNNDISLDQYNSLFFSKAEKSQFPFDIYFLTELLIKQGTDKSALEKILILKKNLWDKGEWSEKFWKLITINNFSIPKDPFYIISTNGEKEYDIDLFISEKLKNKEMGNNPILFVDYNLVSYPLNELLATLKKLNPKDIYLIPKEESISLYGSRGIDGMLEILTKR